MLLLRFLAGIFLLFANSLFAQNPDSFAKSSSTGFIENKGQIIDQNNKLNPSVLYLLNTPGFNVQLRAGGWSYDMYKIEYDDTLTFAFRNSHFAKEKLANNNANSEHGTANNEQRIANSYFFHRIDFDLIGSNPNCEIITSEPSTEYLNYYTTDTTEEGVSGVRSFTSVMYREIYPGIDMEFVTSPEQACKYNFIIRPGGDIHSIRMNIAGPGSITMAEERLILITSLCEVEEMIPWSFVLTKGFKTTVNAHFREIQHGIYGFSVDEEIAENSTLVIDPTTVRLWGTYYGGSNWDSEGQCSVDQSGNVFMAGATLSLTNIATSGSYQSTLAGSYDGFLVKFNAAGQRQWATYFGGTLSEKLGACVVSNNGSIYVSGSTASTSGIASTGAHQTVYGGGLFDCYVEKFDQDGTRLWGTYYGGAGKDSPGYMTVDKYGNVFLTGSTESDTGIATPGIYQPNRYNTSSDVFLAKFNSNGIRQWGTYFGGEFPEIAYNSTTDSTGNVYIAGYTSSHTNIASPGTHQTTYGGWLDGFIAKFNTSGQRLWATYYGGGFTDYFWGCCTDDSGNVYLAGKTGSSTGIATTGSHQPLLGGYIDAFLVKFDSLGVRQWGTYYGGTGNEFAYSCATGRNNDIFMAGNTMSNDNISTPNAYQPDLGGDVDGFIVKFNSGGVRQWGTYYGGAGDDEFLKCSYITDDTLYVSGYTYSTSDIASPGAHQPIYGGARDDLLVKFVECLPIAAAGPITGPATVHQNSSGIQYSIPPLANAVNYVWTLPPGATITGGAGTNNITVNFSGTAISGDMWVKGMNKCGPGDSAFLYITLLPEFFSVGFIAPDTTCINQTINIIDTTTSGTTYYWNFCSGNANTDPNAINIGNPGSLLSSPTSITLVKQYDSCFSFISCQGVGVIRYYHGASFKNNPVSWTNLGNFGGLIGSSEGGIQVKSDNGNWYGFVNSNTTLIRLDFRSSPVNMPTATDIGPFPSFNMAHGLVITREGTNWIGLVTCSAGQNLIRLNFGNTLANNSPVVTDFGSLGGVLISPAAICLVQEELLWFAMILAGGNTLARITFGTSLLNYPTGVNLGNPGGFNSANGLTLLRDCESTSGYWTNYLMNGELGKLTFPAGVLGPVTGTLLGNIGGFVHPHSFSETFRQTDTLYAYITNHDNGTLTRLTFPPCNNASVGSSTLFSPPPFSYDQFGTYNIQLIVNEGLPNQEALCKPIVIIDSPTVNLGSDDSICPGGTKILDAGTGYSSYLWSTGATTQTITINLPGTYWVNVVKWGCTVTDSVQITLAQAPVITIAGNTMVYQGNTEVYTTQPGMTGYTWTFSAGGTWVSGGTATDNTITIQWNTLGAQWVKVNYTYINGCPAVFPTQLNVTVIPSIGFIVPDTTCVNQPVNIVNTTNGGTTYYWNFCSGNSSANPLAINIGNPGNTLNHPMYMALVHDGTDYFSFVTNQGNPGYITRNYHGDSFGNNPSSSDNLLQAGELDHSVEAIQIEQDTNGNWYGFVNNNTTITRLNFGTSLWNIPTTTDLGPFPNIGVAHGSAIIQEGNTWLGFFDSSPTANKLSRLNFGTSLSNIPTYENLGNVAGFSWPCQLAIVKENGLNYMLVINYSPGSLSRVSFGNSLLNAPTGENLGNCGAILSSTGITALNDCETSVGYYTVYLPVPNSAIGRLSFSGGIAGTVTATSLGNTGGYGRPDSFSRIFRQNDSLYAYVMNYDNSSLTRLSFPPCNNASPLSSTLFTPPPISYNQPGTYNIRLIVDEGMLTEASACRPIVVMDPPTVNIGPDTTICPDETRILSAGSGFSSYLWSTGATSHTITINSPGTYWVDAAKWGCTATDTIHITLAPAPVINLGNDTAICDGMQITFDAGACTGCTYLWANLTTSQMNIGNGQSFTTDAAADYMVTVSEPNSCPGRDTVQLSVTPLFPVAVSVAASQNPACPGTWVTFLSNPTNEGSNPLYQWKVNGGNVGGNTSSYSYIPLNGDLVSVVLTSSETCTSDNPATSIPLQMVITPTTLLVVTISASLNPFCLGAPVTFTATPVAGLIQTDYQWKVNGTPQGPNNPVYTYIPANGDQVLCILSSTDNCIIGSPATSNTLLMAQNNNFPASVGINASPNPFCPGSPVTFTAFPTNGGAAPSYQWKRNGVNAGGNASTFTCNPSAGDSIRCIMTSNLACVTQNPANSNTIQMTTLPAPVVIFQACFDTITTTNAQPFKLKGGIPLGGTYSGSGVNPASGIFYPAIAGQGNHLITYSYTNLANCIALATATVFNFQFSIFNCDDSLTDIRDNKKYPTVQIGSQCWMAANLNYGTEIPYTAPQRDNCIPEKYCNNISPVPCALSSALYQWDEVMTYSEMEESQGLCPPGWHVPTEADWNQLFAVYQGNAFAGKPLLYSGYSGFNAQLTGIAAFNLSWHFDGFATICWSSTSHGPWKAWAHGMNEYNYSVSYYPSYRGNAFSIRCLRD